MARRGTALSFADMGIPGAMSSNPEEAAGSVRNLMSLFDSFDRNQDGVIDRHEFRALYEQYCGKVPGPAQQLMVLHLVALHNTSWYCTAPHSAGTS